MEALLRLPGYLGREPVEYAIGLAGEMGLLPELGSWVVRAPCAAAATGAMPGWRHAHLHQHLRQGTAGSRVSHAAGGAGGERRVGHRRRDRAHRTRCDRAGAQRQQHHRAIAARGFMVSLDDFGTGYSSLSYLRALPVSTIKLDKSFLRGVPGSDDANAVVKLVIQLAHDLRLNVVAEGVESAAQAVFSGDAGCGAFQGYLYTPAMPPMRPRRGCSAHL
jgi:EAL domain-containing protein (putative c-di-GMP-specific phosphodiesterase class I)